MSPTRNARSSKTRALRALECVMVARSDKGVKLGPSCEEDLKAIKGTQQLLEVGWRLTQMISVSVANSMDPYLTTTLD